MNLFSYSKNNAFADKVNPDIRQRKFDKVDSFNSEKMDNFPFECRFTRAYLEHNKKAGLGKGTTPSSFMSYFFDYGNKHQADKVKTDFADNPESCFKFLSKTGKEAFYPIELFDEYLNSQYKTLLTLKKLNPGISCNKLIIQIRKKQCSI